MKLVISDPKTGKAYSKALETPLYVGKKIGEEVPLDAAGLPGYTGKISGGSDNDGFPMKSTLDGQARKSLRMKMGTGFRPKKKGEIKRKTVRGKTVSDDIAQLNLVITKPGQKKIDDLLGQKETPKEGGEAEKAPGEKPAEAEEKPGEKPKEEKKEKPVKKEKSEKTGDKP